MKKLKTALILLFALVMSLCLFACGGEGDNPGPDTPGPDTPGPDTPGPDDPEDGEYAGLSLSQNLIQLTDSDGEEQLLAEFEKITVTATEYDGFTTKDFKLTECEYDTSVVQFHTVGEYSITVDLEPSVDTPEVLTVSIEHDWKEEGGVKVCQYDNARMEETTEDVTVHFGTFHEGIYPSNYATAKAAAGWAETDAYTNKNVATSKIQPFGEVNGVEVPSLTAGQLEPGMTITIYGTAKTTVASDPTNSPWGAEQQYWNSPSLGIADRNNTTMRNPAHPTYEGANGVSVIVRQEGWVLYNGVGTTATNRLGGIMGGFFETTNEWRNYGSHSSENDTPSPSRGAEDKGYSNKSLPTDWSAVEDWWVWSTGDGMDSGTCYGDSTEYVYSWYYRMDGVIEITYIYKGTTERTLKAYIKVPDGALGYYDTLIQGDYNDMTITKTEIITTSTPKENGFKYNGVKSGAQTVYAENMNYDASALNITVEYVQDPGKQNTVNVTRNQVYRYIGELDRAALAANSDELYDNSKWESLGTRKLQLKPDGTDYIYKVQVAKGGVSFATLLGENDLKVKPNSVDSALGSDVTIGEETFKNNGKAGDLAFSFDGTNVVLTLNGGYAQKMTAAQKTAMGITDNGDYAYVALRLNKADGIGEAFSDEVSANNATVKANVSDAGDLYLVVAFKAAAKVTLTGAQDTPILLDLSGLKGFSLTSSVTSQLTLNGGGEVTLTYTVPAGTEAKDIKWTRSGNSIEELQGELAYGSFEDGDYSITAITFADNTLTIKLTAKGLADLSDYVPYTFGISIEENGAEVDSVSDTVEFNMALEANEKFIQSAQNNYFAFVTEEGKLNIVKAFSSADLQNGTVEGLLTLNLNNGDYDAFAANGLLTIDYALTDGELVLKNVPDYVTGYAVIRGTFGDDRDTDIGAYVVITIDVADEDGLAITGDYYFEVTDGGAFDETAKPTSLNKVSGTQISSVTVGENDSTVVIIIEGTCQQQGLYAWEVKQNGNVIYYAKAAVAGGVHVNEDGDGNCDLCGAAMSTVHLTDNEENQENILNDGEFVEISGTYSDVAHKGVFNGIETNVRNNGGSAFYVRVRNDGYYARETGGDDLITLDYNSTSETHGVELGTCNGVPNGIDGTPIDEASYLAAKRNGTFKVYASYVNGVVTVVTKLWTAEQSVSNTPYFEYTVRMTVVSKAPSIKVRFRIDSYQNGSTITTVEDCQYAKGEASHSTVTGVEFAAVGSHAAPTEMQISNRGNYITLSGNAGAENGSYYTAFKVTFASALIAGTSVTVRKADGSVYANATAQLNDSRTELLVYLPLSADTTSAIVDFVNFAGNTIQNDLTIDLSGALLSDVKVSADKQDLKLVGDTFTLTLTGTVPATAKLAIGDDSADLSALASASESAPVAIGELFSVVGYNATAKTVTLKYAGVSDYLNDLAAFEIRVTDAEGKALARISVYPNTLEDLARQIETSGWYLVANGGTLMLISDKASAATLPVVINAGKTSESVAVGVYELAYNGGKFTDYNIVTNAAKIATVTLNNKTVTAIVITLQDITGLGITATGAYGVMLAAEGAQKYYAVASDRTITEQDATAGTAKELSKHSCDMVGKSGKTNADESFYWDFTVVPAHSYPATDTNGYYVCTECGAILRGGDVKGATVPADVLAVEGDDTLVDQGLTVSFWATVGDSDWGAAAITSAKGDLIITLPNLDPWNIKTGLAENEEALAAKLRNANCYPDASNLIGGVAYSVFLNGSSYVTISISKTDGVKYYKNGVLVVSYPADKVVGQGTVADVAELMLLLAEHYGIRIGNGLTAASDVLIEKSVYTEEQAAARYTNYSSEKNYYPTHTHQYGDDDKCTCGELNPNHGDPSKGGKAHNFDPATDKCTMCGLFNPDHQHKDEHGEDGTGDPDGICDICGKSLNHVHTFENGVCSECNYVCTHTFTAEEGKCSVCGQVTGKQLSSEELTDTTNGFAEHSKMYTMTKPADGKALEVVYTATFATDANPQDYFGIVTRFFDGDVSSAFLQGNCFLLGANTDPWGTKANADRTIAGYGTVSKAGYFCRVTVLWQGTTIKVTYELWTAEDDLNEGPDKTGTVTFFGLDKETYNVFFGQDGVTSTDAKLVVNEFDATASGTPDTPVTPETGTKNVPASEIPAWADPYLPSDVATLTDGTTVKITGQFADGGAGTWNGLMYWIRDGVTNNLLYVFRQAGDCATATWQYGQGTVNPGFMGDTASADAAEAEKANAYVTLKKNAKFEVVVTYMDGTVTITVTVFGADDTTSDDDQVLSVVLSNMTSSSYKLALALDGATLTDAGLTVTTTVEAE